MHLFQWMSDYQKHPFVIESNIHDGEREGERFDEYLNGSIDESKNETYTTNNSVVDLDKTTSKLQHNVFTLCNFHVNICQRRDLLLPVLHNLLSD